MSQPVGLFDLDGTLFRWQLFHELVFELNRRGAFDDETATELTTALFEWQAKHRSWSDYEMAIVRALRKHVQTIPLSLFDDAAATIIEQSGHKIYNYTKKLADKLKQDGYFLLAVTGSHQEIAGPFALRYGFDDCIGVVLERKDGHFTGELTREVYSQKATLIKNYLKDHGMSLNNSVAIGDSYGDIPMLELAEQVIAFNPSTELYDEALKRGWELVIERKNQAYTLRKDSDGHYLLAHTDQF